MALQWSFYSGDWAPVKELWKSINIWCTYIRQRLGSYFLDHVYLTPYRYSYCSFLLGRPLPHYDTKNPKAASFQSDEMWQDCSSSEHASIDGVGFQIWRHTFKMATVTSFREQPLARHVWRHWLRYVIRSIFVLVILATLYNESVLTIIPCYNGCATRDRFPLHCMLLVTWDPH